jgi:DNA replication initiation complex subunit (GINS family)
MPSLDYQALREHQKKEMGSLELVQVGPEFYSEIAVLLEQKRTNAIKTRSLVEIRELENLRKVAKSIVGKRKEKLMHISILVDRDFEGLAKEEHEFLHSLRSLCGKSFNSIESAITEAREQEALVESAFKKVKVISAIAAYKGCDNNIYGPFTEGQEISLPEMEAEILLKNKNAEQIS